MPTDQLKGNNWSADGSNSSDVSDQQLSNYYNAAASQYNQHYNLYSSPYYRFPYLPTANANAIYGHGYPAGFDYNGYPAAYGVQYYNKSMGTAGTSPISTFQQYTNNLVTAGNFNAVAAAAAINQSTTQPTSNYYANNTQKSVENKPKKTKRKKQPAVGGKQEIIYKRVYIWELDELFGDEFSQQLLYNPDLKKLLGQILTLGFQLNSADDFDHTNIEDANVDENLAEQSTNNFSADPFPNLNLKTEPQTMEKQQLQVGDNSQQIIQNDPMSMNMTALDNIKRMAACQQRIRSVYNRHQLDIISLVKSFGMEQETPTLCRMLETLRRMDINRPYTQCLKLIYERSNQASATGAPQQVNVILTQDPLSFALAKILINGSSNFIQVENVYSASRSDISTPLERVISRFKREKLVMISGKAESIQLGRSLNIPVWPVTQAKDIENFYVALDRILC